MLLSLLLTVFLQSEPTPVPPADTLRYQIYTGSGQPVTLETLVTALQEADVVFVGEQHDDPSGHAFQDTLLKAVQARYGLLRPVALSLEMFERDVQYILDEYLTGQITERHFLASSRPWEHYATDYRPMVEFAKAQRLPVLAANAPRRYVNRVSRLGATALDTLSAHARQFLPPLPFPEATPAYQAKWQKLMGGDSTQAAMPHGNMGFMLASQSLWDAGMAWSIHEHLQQHPDALVLHMAGAFHVEGRTGTPEALQHYHPGTRMVVIVMRPHTTMSAFDAAAFGGLGDFVVLTDARQVRSAQP
jgi:uncharacterized iron-regulated protein